MVLHMNFSSRMLLLKSTVLFFSLVITAILGHIAPKIGVLIIGISIASAIELTRIRFRQNTLAITLVMFSTMTLVWGWISPQISFLSRPMALLMFFAWGVYCLSSTEKPLQRHWSISSISALVLSIIIYFQDSNHMVAPLLMGYDNSAHVPALSQVYRHSGFLYSGTLPELFTFGNYVHGYPPLQSATWAFIMSIGNVQINGGYEILNYFGFFYFGTALTIISLTTNCWTIGLSKWFRFNFRLLVTIAVGILIAFSQASYMFWLGFPPFFWACGITIAITGIISNSNSQSQRVLVGILGLTLINYSYPLLSPVLVLVLVYEILKMSKTDLKHCWSHRSVVALTALTAGVLNVAVVLESLNVRHYLDDGGGIQPIELRNLLPIVVLVVLMVIFCWTSIKSIPSITIAFLASSINFGALAILSQSSQGSVSYYPQKAGYLALILGFGSMGWSLAELPRMSRPRIIQYYRILTFGITIGLLWFSVQTTSDPTYAKYGYPSTDSVWNQLKYNPANPNRSCFLRAMDITADVDSNSNRQTILFLQDDLQTRWINGVRGRLTDATYSISIPLGQGAQTLPEILKGLFIQYPNARLLILSPEPPIGIEEWNNKIEYRHFSCA